MTFFENDVVNKESEQPERQLALLQCAGFTPERIKSAPTIETAKMAPLEAEDNGTNIKVYCAANPPVPEHKVDKDKIEATDSDNRDCDFEFNTSGSVPGASETFVHYGWIKNENKPGDLTLVDKEITYSNSDPKAKQQGLDIRFNEASAEVGKNTKRLAIYPSNDPKKSGYDCEIESYPEAETDGFVVRISRAFVDSDGTVQRANENNIGNILYKYEYLTQDQHFEKLDENGQGQGLKSVVMYADPDGGRTKKLMEIHYVDAAGKRNADGSPMSSTIYDPDSGREVRKEEYGRNSKGALVTTKITEYKAGGGQYITELNPEDQQWLKRTDIAANGNITEMTRNPADDTITLKLPKTREIKAGQDKGSGTIIFKKDSNGDYQINSVEMYYGDNKLQAKITPGRLRMLKDSTGKITGLGGVTFYDSKGIAIPPSTIQKLFGDDAKWARMWEDVIKQQKK